MAQAKKSNKKPQAGTPDKWFTPAKPDFIKLEVGEVLTGVYLGRKPSQYGPTYRFQNGDKVQVLSGNRVSLDNLMDQVDAANLKGHLLTVERMGNDESNSGRKVNQYRVGHISQGCPGCGQNIPAGFK
jgi:hypothetical protein